MRVRRRRAMAEVGDLLDEEREESGEEGHIAVALNQVLLVHALFVPCTGQAEGAKTPKLKKMRAA